jgi:hypothetical protein
MHRITDARLQQVPELRTADVVVADSARRAGLPESARRALRVAWRTNLSGAALGFRRGELSPLQGDGTRGTSTRIRLFPGLSSAVMTGVGQRDDAASSPIR